MQDRERKRIREIKLRVMGMLGERQAIAQGTVSGAPPEFRQASQYWTDFCGYFDYLMGMDEDSFAKLRLHTYHLTADNYQAYYFGNPAAFLRSRYVSEPTRDLPARYLLNEPDGGIGFKYPDGRFLSSDVLRYQRVVATLFRAGTLGELALVKARIPRILEIGAGYGGMAHHVARIVADGGARPCYYVVDLPETLLFSASYLTLLNPEKRVYLYSKDDFDPESLDEYDFVLIPNYRLESLAKKRFELVLNVASLQEMNTAQAVTYLDFIQQTCAGIFYSWNQDHQPKNRELESLSDLLRSRFYLTEQAEPIPRIAHVLEGGRRRLQRIAVGLGLHLPRQESPAHLRYREYIGRPKTD